MLVSALCLAAMTAACSGPARTTPMGHTPVPESVWPTLDDVHVEEIHQAENEVHAYLVVSMTAPGKTAEDMTAVVMAGLIAAGWSPAECRTERRYDCARKEGYFVAVDAKDRAEPFVVAQVTG